MFALNPLQYDTLCEAFNIGVGRAAAAMSQIVQETIDLSVPSVEFVTADYVFPHSADGEPGVSGVSQRFQGNFPGVALLMFPQQQSLEIVRLMMQDNVPLEQLTELEQDALLEVGNILLNVCIASLSDILDAPMPSELPELCVFDKNRLPGEFHSDNPTVMLLHIRFAVVRRQIDGRLAFILGMKSLERLREALDRYLGQLSETG
jgi:chemotaxis protein CheC